MTTAATRIPGPPSYRRRNFAARAADGARDFVRRVVQKAGEDDIFFLAGAIAFNVVIAFVPLLFASLGIAGTILRMQRADPGAVVLDYITQALPEVGPEFERAVLGLLNDIIGQSTGLLSVGTIILIWVATRLVGTLRTVLSEVFEIHQRRGIIAGKLFDLKMVVAAGTLLALNVALTVAVELATRFGVESLGIRPSGAVDPRAIYGAGAAFVSLWVMFLLIYRYLPAHKIPWRTALIAATFTALLLELMKRAFSWYAINMADFTSLYGGPVAMLVILILWVYYSAVVFILGGEVAQVAALQRIRKRQRERLAT